MQAKFFDTPEVNKFFQLFVQGDERGFTYVYNCLYKKIFDHARYILQDESVINTIINDIFLSACKRRETMENTLHIFHFVRRGVKWRCHKYLRSGRNQFYKNIVPLDCDDTNTAVYDPEKEMEEHDRALTKEESLELIEKAIRYMRKDRQIVLELYKRGFSHKRIAKTLGKSHQGVTLELKECIEALRSFYIRIKWAADASRRKPIILAPNYKIYLTPRQAEIIRLSVEEKQTFPQIAQIMNLPQMQVVKQYFMAMKKINSLNRKRRRYHNQSTSFINH